ncbi:hypothetical protein SAMN05920897_110106 [Alkalispirochaeta americana]|uniref:VWFA domain-containing protein n=1 Tax=Alkalispirochaeta americana TaxID=159291 RepID=A0A1N6TLR4_9SPIO|nr:hypothetical protein [Alkalispirochaeta americana]SIQ54275.1 hypothetical protein SAMN05920897_110106 [Alkalispirochaeta americana]
MNWSSTASMEASQQIRTVLFRELYRFFTDPEGVSAPEKESAPAGSKQSATELPPPLARSVEHFYTLLLNTVAAGTDDALAEQISAEVSSWFASIWADLQHQGRERPSAPDLSAGGPDPTSGTESPSAALTAEGLEKQLRLAQNTWPRHRERWDQLQQKLPFATTDRHLQVLQKRFLDARHQALQEQRELQQERALRLVANPLADHLNNLIPRLQHHQHKLQSLLGVTGRWNILEADPQDLCWETLSRCNAFLESAPGLKHLCQLLLKDLSPPGVRETTITDPLPRVRQVEEDLGCGEITGLGLGSAFPGVLPGELALLADDATEALFLRKLSDQSLLQLQHQRRCLRTHWSSPPAREMPGPRPALGKLILCIDTSGSMRGTPEAVARATILGVLSEALKRGRSISVFACTPQLEVLETAPLCDEEPLSREGFPETPSPALKAGAPPEIPEELLLNLLNFLDRPFTEGYDVSPAMEAALNLLENSDPGASSDVVLISDIPYPKIPPRHLNRMHQLQRSRRARFQTLTIHEEPMQDPLNVFDYRWFFNTGAHPEVISTGESRMIGLDSQAFLHF